MKFLAFPEVPRNRGDNVSRKISSNRVKSQIGDIHLSSLSWPLRRILMLQTLVGDEDRVMSERKSENFRPFAFGTFLPFPKLCATSKTLA
jgi:hypothetical protein